jgi:hypothetical protein
MRAVHGAHAARLQGASRKSRSQCVECANLARVGRGARAANMDPALNTIWWLRDSIQFTTMRQLVFSGRVGNMRIQAFAMGVALAWATVGVARAADVEFTISGGDRTATFELALSPTPNPALLDYSFSIISVSAVVEGSPTRQECRAADSLRTIYSIFSAPNFIQAQKTAQRSFPASIKG